MTSRARDRAPDALVRYGHRRVEVLLTLRHDHDDARAGETSEGMTATSSWLTHDVRDAFTEVQPATSGLWSVVIAERLVPTSSRPALP